MDDLTEDDYWAAAFGCSERVVELQRTLTLIGDHAPLGYTQQLTAKIATERARGRRFQDAAMARALEAAAIARGATDARQARA